MPSPDADHASPSRAGGVFATTHWSVVLKAGGTESQAAQEALEQLCRMYWYPLYAYVRRRGYSPEDAQDLTQDFFVRLLERDLLAGLKPAGAKFRSFLLATLKNHLASDWVRSRAAKHGGKHFTISLEALDLEAGYAQEPMDTNTPDVAFERHWAETILRRALERLREELTAEGKQALFDGLVNCLTGAAPPLPYAEQAVRLGMSEAAVKMAAHRMRKRYGELLRREVANTVSTAAEIDQELRYLLAALAAR